METKVCKKCGEKKTMDHFAKSKTCVGGYSHECKSCRNERLKSYRRSRVIVPGEKVKEELKPLEGISSRLLILELRARGYAGELTKTTIEKVVI